jgi:hypothetical protein
MHMYVLEGCVDDWVLEHECVLQNESSAPGAHAQVVAVNAQTARASLTS